MKDPKQGPLLLSFSLFLFNLAVLITTLCSEKVQDFIRRNFLLGTCTRVAITIPYYIGFVFQSIILFIPYCLALDTQLSAYHHDLNFFNELYSNIIDFFYKCFGYLACLVLMENFFDRCPFLSPIQLEQNKGDHAITCAALQNFLCIGDH